MKKISALAIAGVFTASLAATAFAEMADVKVGGEIRVRDVVTNNYDFNKDNADRNNTVTSRTRVNVDAKIDETTKAYVSIQNTKVWGDNAFATGNASVNANGNTLSTGEDTTDVKEAYLQLDKLFGQPLSLKLGRQQLAYGEHRLIGNFEWSNIGRSFDALKLAYNQDAFSLDLFTAKVREAGALNAVGTEVPTKAGDPTSYLVNSEDSYFNGLYATVKSIPTSTLDLYLLQKKDSATSTDANGSSATVSGAVNKQDILTYGARINGGAMNIDWTAEGAIQTGDAGKDTSIVNAGGVTNTSTGTIDKEASFYALRAGYTIPEAASLRIGAEYVSATGDKKADDKDKTFDNLYPTNHPLYGVSDVADTNTLSGPSGYGLTAWSINASAKPVKGLKLLAEYWNYSATEDYTYTKKGGATATDDAIGNEFNIQAWYAISENVGLHAYWARFSPDSNYAQKKNGSATVDAKDDAADNVTLQVAVKF